MKYLLKLTNVLALILTTVLSACTSSYAGPVAAPIDPASMHGAAVWSKMPNSLPWTVATIQLIRKNKQLLDTAQDIESFCEDYSQSTPHLQEICWLRIIGAVVQFESDFNPNLGFQENDGNVSVGLLQMSPSECPESNSTAALRDPQRNLRCGINKMARMINHYGQISGEHNIGAAKTWSVLREPYKAYVKSLGKYVWLGRKDRIIELSSSYSNYKYF